jgi:hypothetical protein
VAVKLTKQGVRDLNDIGPPPKPLKTVVTGITCDHKNMRTCCPNCGHWHCPDCGLYFDSFSESGPPYWL